MKKLDLKIWSKLETSQVCDKSTENDGNKLPRNANYISLKTQYYKAKLADRSSLVTSGAKRKLGVDITLNDDNSDINKKVVVLSTNTVAIAGRNPWQFTLRRTSGEMTLHE